MSSWLGRLINRTRKVKTPLTKEQEEIERIKQQRADWQRDAIIDHKNFGHF